jgi:catechol 2,3-dioxygenase-like lactoylglutathione lyase family enzyme
MTPMISGSRYVHTNLVARDWRRLARFYEDVFGCRPVPPERDLSGADMVAGTGVPGAHLRGMHLRLPGTGPNGPTLEIFEYSQPAADEPRIVNRPGFAHIAFVGDVVTVAISATAQVTWCYVRDPEGNIVELQKLTPPGDRESNG